MPVRVRYFTDPASSAAWAAEPLVRKLMVEFGAKLSFEWVMAGLVREYEGDAVPLVARWLEDSERSGMPVDPRLWLEGPISSSYPACMAVKAAAEQGEQAAERYLRGLREGLLCFRRKLDTTEALVEEARRAGLDAGRYRIDLGSHAIVEAFGADLEAARPGGEPLPLPSACFGDSHWVRGEQPYEAWREAALAAGASPAGDQPPGVLEALRRFGRMAAVEVEAVCGLPGPRASAELWTLAEEWKVRPVPVLAGALWELA